MTPEAKLLDLLRRGSPSHKGLARARLSVQQAMTRARTKVSQWNTAASRRVAHLNGYERLNRIFVVASGVGLVYLVAGFWSPIERRPGEPRVAKANVRKEGAASPREMLWTEVARRNPFRPLIAPPPPPPKIVVEAPPPPPPIPLRDRVSHLRLAGFMSGKAIVEDQQTQKTLYVAPGEMIGDVEVEKATADSLTLKSGDERFNLTM